MKNWCKPDCWLLLESMYLASTIRKFSLFISKKKKLNNSKSKKALFWVPCIASHWTKSTYAVLITGSNAAKAPPFNRFISEKFLLRGKHVCEVKETIWISTSFCTKYTYCCEGFSVCVIYILASYSEQVDDEELEEIIKRARNSHPSNPSFQKFNS